MSLLTPVNRGRPELRDFQKKRTVQVVPHLPKKCMATQHNRMVQANA
jgi:hypothetical protein